MNVVLPEFYKPIILQFKCFDLNKWLMKSEKAAPILKWREINLIDFKMVNDKFINWGI